MNRSRADEPDHSYTAVVMAGRRGGEDPVATHGDKSHKCLVAIAGRPMLWRVIEALEASACVRHIVLCADRELSNSAFIDQRLANGSLSRLEAAGSPAASATQACVELTAQLPLLVVTADHPLLSAAMIDHFCQSADPNADIVAALARSDLVLDAYPGAVRTLLRFADGPYCGCNLFALNTERAQRVTTFWMRLEAERKRPWRLVRLLGILALLSYAGGRLTLRRALDVLERKLDIRAQSVLMREPEAAIDVDKPTDLLLVESILAAQAHNDDVTV